MQSKGIDQRRAMSIWRRVLIMGAALAMVVVSTGCGQMTIRTWITIIDEESSGNVAIALTPGQTPTNLKLRRLQGGFLTTVRINTSDLPNPMNGTIVLEDVRMAGKVAGLVGRICTYNDPDPGPEGGSGGSMVLDLLGGDVTTSLKLDAKAYTEVSQLFNFPPVDFEEDLDFDLGEGFGIDQFLGAFLSGSADGLFATSMVLQSTLDLQGIQADFTMNTVVTNSSQPPLIDADLLAFCEPFFEQQGNGRAIFYGINTKSSYMRRSAKDQPIDPLAIPLAEVGAVPGDVLRIRRVGNWATIPALTDGNLTLVGGVFSSSNEIRTSEFLNRITGAIDAGPNLNSWWSWVCLWECADFGGDNIIEDFPINGTLDIVVPAGAQYLFVSTVDWFRVYQDNTGMGLGVTLEVNP